MEQLNVEYMEMVCMCVCLSVCVTGENCMLFTNYAEFEVGTPFSTKSFLPNYTTESFVFLAIFVWSAEVVKRIHPIRETETDG